MFLAPQVGLEPTTLRLTAECSAIELLRNIHLFRTSFGISLCGMRRRSTLPGRYQPSTLDVLRLNFCVRYGNRWIPQAITTAKGELIWVSAYVVTHADNRIGRNDHFIGNLYGSPLVLGLKSSFRPISIIKLHTLLRFHR